jgi:hypothetical protein
MSFDPVVLQAIVGGASAAAVWLLRALITHWTQTTHKGAVALLQDAAIGLAWFSPTPRETLLKACESLEVAAPPSHYIEKVFYRLDKCERLTATASQRITRKPTP